MSLSHSDLAERYADGADKGTASNMFIEEETIYSYGYHFPIATKIGHREYLFNSNSYSSSTGRHKNKVEWALSGATLWETPHCKHENIQGYLAKELVKALRKIYLSRSRFLNYMDHLVDGVDAYIRAMKRFPEYVTIKPMFQVFQTERAHRAFTRIKKEDKLSPTLNQLFMRAQFLPEDMSKEELKKLSEQFLVEWEVIRSI